MAPLLLATSSHFPGSPMTALQSLSDDLAAAVDRASAALVSVHARRRIPASGILWKPDVVITNHHVIQREEGIKVTLADGTTVGATLAGRDPATDIAALRLERPAPTSAALGHGPLKVGQLVLALGRPGPAVTAALGVVSSAGGEWRTWSGGRIDQFVSLDVSIYDGFSGGALVNSAGEIVGMNSSGLSRGAAMTIPFPTIIRVAEQLLTSGHMRRGYVGVGLQSVRLPSAIASQLTPARDVGLMVVSVDDGGPAALAGLHIGDVIVAFDGHPASEPSEMLAQLTGDRIGQIAAVRVLRAGAFADLLLTVGERPARAGRR